MLYKIGGLLVRYRRSYWVEKIHNAILILHRAIENVNYSFEKNGEKWTLRTIAANRKVETVFDVGANRGDWTKMARELFPAATVHSFEVIPSTYRELSNHVGGDKFVHLNNIGLSDTVGSLTMFFDETKDVLATTVKGFSEEFHGYAPNSTTLPVTTGDAYCLQHGITHIDILKIDVEGHEPNVLRGFERMLAAGAIDVIQFEYGYINIDTGFLLKNFHQLLEGFDMRVGKIFPNHVQFRNYKHTHEDFYGPNFLAVRARDQPLLQALGG